MSSYPTYEKLKGLQDALTWCGEFLEWLLGPENRLSLCRPHEHAADCYAEHVHDDCARGCSALQDMVCGMLVGAYYPVHLNVENTLARFFGIDLDKLESEKRAMLDELRKKVSEDD